MEGNRPAGREFKLATFIMESNPHTKIEIPVEAAESDAIVHWPGQIPFAYYSLEQVRALSSVVRSEVFWTFSVQEPLSTSQIANALQRSAPTTRYHVNELLKADLLLPVEVRKRRSRTEDAYVHKIVDGYTPRPPLGRDYLYEMHRGFSAIVRVAARERRAALQVANEDPDYYLNTAFRHLHLRLPLDKVRELRERLHEVIYEFNDDASEDGMTVHFGAFLAPVMQENRRVYREIAGKDTFDWDAEEE